MKKLFLFFALFGTIAILAVSGQVSVGKRVDSKSTPKSKYFDAGRLLRDVEYLASDELEGRSADLPSIQKARDHVEKRFRESGLKPFGNSYKQEFQITERGSDKKIPGVNFVGQIKGKKQPDKYIVITAITITKAFQKARSITVRMTTHLARRLCLRSRNISAKRSPIIR